MHFTAEAQSSQRFSEFGFPVRGRKTKKTLLTAVHIALSAEIYDYTLCSPCVSAVNCYYFSSYFYSIYPPGNY
jgi:hypothetical protein